MTKKNSFSKLIVVLVVVLNSVFSAAVLYVFFRLGKEPVILIGAWFGFTTGELWLLSQVKKTKIKGIGEEKYEHSNNQTKVNKP